MTFRISRSGSFGGFGSLDPFGSSRGGLGRYNLGSDIASLEAYEAYVIAIGWQNGTVSDDEYLDSLKRQWDMAPAGSKEWEGARDKYNDAVYTIARNKIVNDVNLATSSSERVAGLRRLMAHDRERMGGMVEDNEQRRELAARIRSTEADIRSTEYGDLVEKYNRGQATTQQLIDFVNRAIGDSRGAPDNDDWQKTLGELGDRRNDEVVAGKYQDYQHNRQDGTDLLATLDAQLATLTPGSPKYLELSRQREDLARSIRETKLAKQHDKTYNDWQNGKITDSAYLKDLERAAQEAPAGTREEQAAKQRLLETRFSLAEDKLQYKVQKGTASNNDLIRFYRSYLATMNPDSYRARQLTLAIDRLKGGGSAGGSGGGSGGGSSSSGALGEPQLNKILGVPVPFQSAMNTKKDANGKPIPAGALNDLLNLDASDVTDRNYYNNNRRSMDMAFEYGARTWLFIDKKGNRYEVPFNAEMYDAFLERGEVGFRVWMENARNPKEAQTAAGMWLSSAQRLLRFRGNMSFEDYRKQFSTAERAKQAALAAGNVAAYISLTRAQQQMIRQALGIVDPEAPTDVSLAGNPLSDSQKSTLASDIDAISPYQPMPPTGAGQDPQNLKGDKIMYAIENELIKFSTITVPGTDQTIEADVWVDENRAFFTQTQDGRIDLVADVWDQDSFAPVALEDGTYIPAYKAAGNMVPTVLYQAPETDRLSGAGVDLGPGPATQVPVTVWTPVSKSPKFAAKLMVKLVDNGAGSVDIVGPSGQAMTTTTTSTQVAGPAGAATINTTSKRPSGYTLAEYPGGVPLWTTRVKTWTPEGYKYQTWVSTEQPGTKGAIWLKLPNEGYGMMPRVVLDPKGVNFVRDASGQLGIRQSDGSIKTATPDDLAPHVRFYNRGDAGGPAGVGIGAPGIDFDWTIADYQGRLNTYRPTSRAERETIEVVDREGNLTTRQRTANLENEAQRAERYARARGAGTSMDRNIDRQAYYDPGTEKWVSGVSPRKPQPLDAPTVEFPPRGGRSEYMERVTTTRKAPYYGETTGPKSVELRGISRPAMAFPPQKGITMTAPTVPLPTINAKKPMASYDKTKPKALKPIEKKQYETNPKPKPKQPPKLTAPTIPLPPKPKPPPKASSGSSNTWGGGR